MQATTAKVLDGSCASQVTGSSANEPQSDTDNGQKLSLPKPQNFGSWIVERRLPLDKQSGFCCGGAPRYRESVIKCLAEYKLLPETPTKSVSGVKD
ncbi:hypothetical protein [Endozoicomonas sp. YOMI1]|uniref:hypothetical protein n=1 Tax=Endozoicomonas sp. YOMI1 TaxID=2828739 RepID=UPI0021497E90|nr:hypothetical protein [Endozoicomonas sp. YOMI1]